MQQAPSAIQRLHNSLRVLILLLFVTTCTLYGQIAGTGSIQGTVTDSSGAVVQNATVNIINQSTQVTRTAKTDSSGVYAVPNINVGTYSVSVTAQGFQTFTDSGIVLEVGSSISVNVKLTVGEASEKIEVKADSLALQTEDASFKQTVDQQDITEMPLLTISGGANTAPAGDFTGSKYSYQTISVSIAGGGGNTTLWRLDGGDNNDYMANGNLPFPFPDAVSQFSVESTALGAQEGMHSGGLVNVVTRSGTNTFHGSAFEFIRNNYIDATNFFATSKDTLHQNQYGGTFGGPILRDKLFAFAGYQHLKNDQATATTQAHVPTAANLAGDFSVTDPPPGTTITGSSCATKAIQLLDPLTGAIIPGNKYTVTPAWNAQALALQKYLPATTDPCGLVNYSIPSQIADNEFVVRVDYTINSRNNLYGRYFIDGYQAPAFFSPTNILITTASGNIERTQSFTLGEDFAVNSKLINSAHATILRRSNNRGYSPSDINAATLGVNLYQAVPNGLQLAAANKFTIGGGGNSVSHFNDNTLALDDDITLIRGKHQFVFGGEFVRNQLNITNAYEGNGIFEFGGLASGSGPNGGSVVGDANLDFLEGAMTPSGQTPAFQQSKEQQNALRAPIPSLYFQDTFHATSNLTLVAGIRWSPEFMPVDVFNRGTVFNYADFLANQVSTIYPNAPAGTLFYGDAGVPRAFTKNSPVQFSPNIGAAWATNDGKWVFRGGAELIYDEVNFFTGQRTQQNPPFATAISQVQTSTSGPVSFTSPWSSGSITTSPFPQPPVPTPAQAQFFAQSQYIVMPTQFKPSYTMQWTGSVQHQFGKGWEVQFDYVGNKTTHAPLGLPLSPATYIPGNWGANGAGCAGVVITAPFAGKYGAAGTPCSTTANQAQRFFLTEQNPVQGNQYAGGGGGSALVGDEGTSNYNGLIVTVQHRLSSSFSLLTNYTWSKCLNEADSQGDLAGTSVENPNNPAMDYGPCGSDYRDVENVVLVTKSNFSLPRFEKLVVNGWEFAPLAHITSGAPFTVTTGSDISLTDVGNDRPNLIPGVAPYIHLANRSASGAANRGYLNPAAFCGATVAGGCTDPVAPGTYGNISRNSFRGLPQYQFDAQISRIFPVHERLTMTLRLEGFNVLNHPNFSTPTAALSSSTFGQISATSNNARVFQGSAKFNF
jgi:hypothetical protein